MNLKKSLENSGFHITKFRIKGPGPVPNRNYSLKRQERYSSKEVDEIFDKFDERLRKLRNYR